jgi:hypothetical protein
VLDAGIVDEDVDGAEVSDCSDVEHDVAAPRAPMPLVEPVTSAVFPLSMRAPMLGRCASGRWLHGADGPQRPDYANAQHWPLSRNRALCWGRHGRPRPYSPRAGKNCRCPEGINATPLRSDGNWKPLPWSARCFETALVRLILSRPD